MSAHRPKAVTLSPELVVRFALYLYRHELEEYDHDPPIRDWGIFHWSLGECHWTPVAPWGTERVGFSAEEADLAQLFDQLTPSQRRRLRQRVEVVTWDEVAAARRFAERKAQEDAARAAAAGGGFAQVDAVARTGGV